MTYVVPPPPPPPRAAVRCRVTPRYLGPDAPRRRFRLPRAATLDDLKSYLTMKYARALVITRVPSVLAGGTDEFAALFPPIARNF